jgi:hypothetical protein
VKSLNQGELADKLKTLPMNYYNFESDMSNYDSTCTLWTEEMEALALDMCCDDPELKLMWSTFNNCDMHINKKDYFDFVTTATRASGRITTALGNALTTHTLI